MPEETHGPPQSLRSGHVGDEVLDDKGRRQPCLLESPQPGGDVQVGLLQRAELEGAYLGAVRVVLLDEAARSADVTCVRRGENWPSCFLWNSMSPCDACRAECARSSA